MKIIVGQGSCGIAAGAGKVYSALNELIQPADTFTLGITGCIGMCFLEPIVDIYDNDQLVQRLVKVSADKAEAIVNAVRKMICLKLLICSSPMTMPASSLSRPVLLCVTAVLSTPPALTPTLQAAATKV